MKDKSEDVEIADKVSLVLYDEHGNIKQIVGASMKKKHPIERYLEFLNKVLSKW